MTTIDQPFIGFCTDCSRFHQIRTATDGRHYAFGVDCCPNCGGTTFQPIDPDSD